MLQTIKLLSAVNLAKDSLLSSTNSLRLREHEEEVGDAIAVEPISIDQEDWDSDIAFEEPAMIDADWSESSEGMAMIEPAYYDDYYYPYEPYYYWDTYSWLYSNRRVHNMVWSAFAQSVIPLFMFNELTENSQAQAAYWEKIAAANFMLYGPLFTTGIFALSGILPDSLGLYIEYVLSNAQFAVAGYSVYQLVQVLLEGTSTELYRDIAVLAGYSVL